MFEGIVKSITKPVAFFKTLQEDDTLVARAVLVVLLVSLVSAGVGYFSALPSADVLPDSNPLKTFTLISTSLSFIVITFLSWLVYGLVVRMGAGMDVKPWAITGYAMSPLLIIYILIIVLAAIFPVTLPAIAFTPEDPEAFQRALQETQVLYQATVFGRSTQILSYFSSLWWILLIFLGVREAAGSSKAYITAGLVTLLTLAFIIGPFLPGPV